jgi:hypothetical protein
MPAMMTVVSTGIHGAGVAGTQGIGVNTPSAALVAVMTLGLLGDEHMPNGWMFLIGTWSMMLAAGCVLVITLFRGGTTRALGATPNEHWSMAPLQTC